MIDCSFPEPYDNHLQTFSIPPMDWWRILDNSLQCTDVDMNLPCTRMELDLGHGGGASTQSHRLKLYLYFAQRAKQSIKN